MLPRLFKSSTRKGSYQNRISQFSSTHVRPFAVTISRSVVIADQTKKSNDPSSSEQKEEHKQATQGASNENHEHPAKQPDPQPSPSKSTGIREEGPGDSRSGEGIDRGVHTERGAGAGQHR